MKAIERRGLRIATRATASLLVLELIAYGRFRLAGSRYSTEFLVLAAVTAVSLIGLVMVYGRRAGETSK